MNKKIKLLIEQEIGEGDLPIMLFWQSLDGRPQFQHYRYWDDWVKKYLYLKDLLGRNPTLYFRTTDKTIFKEEEVSK